MRIVGEKREGDVSLSTKSDGQLVIEETFQYIVEADSKSDTRLYVAQCPGLPVPGITRSSGGYTICKTVSGQRRSDNPKIWDFTCSFSSEVEENSDTTGSGSVGAVSDPETWVPVRTTLFDKVDFQSNKDVNGKPFANSAGQAFAEGFPSSKWLLSWEFTQFENISVKDEDILDRNEVVNSATFKGKASKTWLCRVIESSVGFYYGQRRRLTKYRLTYNDDTWQKIVPDVGFATLDSNGKLKIKTELTGTIIQVNLNGAGAAVAETVPPTPPALLKFDVYKTSNFSFLRI